MMNDEPTSSGPYSQTSALNDIVTWSVDRPDWQRDALRQLVGAAELEDIDLDRLEALCVGQRDDAEFLNTAHVAPQSTSGKAVTVSTLHSVKGVNALAHDQVLDLSDQGITIVYGDNGSGKSGYCRVLKHACRSRDSKFTILPNIDDDDNTPQLASIDYIVGSDSQSISWSPEAEQVATLTQVSIFDARSANTHVQAENNVAYTPFPMRVLEGLGDLCDELKQRLEARVHQIQEKTPLSISEHQLSEQTSAGKFLGGLSAKSDLTVLSLLCELKEDEQRKLETLRSDLSQDPQKTINSLSAQKQRVEAITAAVRILNSSLVIESVSGFRTLQKAYADAKEASKIASKELFNASPLPQIGSDAWKALWEAARTYSNDVVYPEKQFPATTVNGDRCVLCQQTLGEEAVERQITFETFVKSTTKANEQSCLNALDTRSKELRETRITAETLSAAHALLQDELSLPDEAEALNAWVIAANAKLTAVLEQQDVPSIDVEHPEVLLTKLGQEFAGRIEQVKATQNPEARANLIGQKQDLEDRLLIAGIRNDVEAEIGRLNQIATLKRNVKATARASVTNKNKELSELLVTGALRNRFAREMTKLDLNAIPMELNKTRDRKAQSLFRVEFVGYSGQPLGEILSEGEHRCVALAAFLAELVTSKDYSGIVFDDPMSSLDHIYRERVAKRLAEEAQYRQVVIFTHDLGFLFEVIREAETIDVPLHFQHVKRRGKTPGFISSDLPLKAKTAPAVVTALRTELKDLKGQFETLSETRRVIWTKGIIEQLREAWDQVIADFISPVLGRFDNKIKGNSLFKLLVLTQDDVDLMTAARGRLSEDLHHVAGALNPQEVSHDQLVAEVNVVHDFIESLKKRPKQAEPRISSL